ncbi:MAG: hypothetical protein GY861_23180 [bacterium]|nr:hypothetical protein [bacterium]
MKEKRHHTGYRPLSVSPRPSVKLFTGCQIDDEVFSSLQYVAEVENAGIAHVKSYGHTTNAKDIWTLFQSFTRQAQTFYESAKYLHYRASTLMYYYSFLNLVKAYIALHEPNLVSGRVQHGISHQFAMSDFSKQKVKIDRNGVFPKFYKLIMDTPSPYGQKFKLVDLLAYCQDISYEYANAGFGKPKAIGGMSRLLAEESQKECWAMLAIAPFELLEPYKKSLDDFYKQFQQVSVSRRDMRDLFNLHGWEIDGYAFFESKNTYKWDVRDVLPTTDIANDSYTALKLLFEPKLYDSEYDFFLSLPLRRNLQIPFNQPLAIYMAMFYLGNLVRYHPSYLENLLASKDAWLIERFANSAHSTFLRYMANQILQKDIVYVRR